MSEIPSWYAESLAQIQRIERHLNEMLGRIDDLVIETRRIADASIAARRGSKPEP